jgi:putative OmpL-like beta-barrel porin-2
MKPSLSTGLRAGAACLLAAAWNVGTHTPAWAQQPVPPTALAPGAPAPEAAAPTSNAMAVPAMTGPLVANPNPMHTDFDDFGTIYLTGAISGLTMFQSDHVVGDSPFNIDLSNAHFIVQKTDGLVQFYAHGGLYTFPTLGTPYFHVAKTTGDTFGLFPVGYAKIAPNDAFSIQAGKLPTLIGAEYAFTFQNMNIERGLLWAQEPIISRGVQANYTMGPLALSASLNDGFYSDSYNWLTGSAAWTIDKENTLTFVGGGNFDHTDKNAFTCVLAGCPVGSAVLTKTPFFPNNGDIFNVIYTYNAAPVTITPYFQYTNVPGTKSFPLGPVKGASTYGAALLANFAYNDNLNLAARWEFISSTGSVGKGNVNLLYGPGSDALSFTFTPTYQLGIGFLRADASVVTTSNTTPGFVFGHSGNKQTQGRFVVEAGVVF